MLEVGVRECGRMDSGNQPLTANQVVGWSSEDLARGVGDCNPTAIFSKLCPGPTLIWSLHPLQLRQGVACARRARIPTVQLHL